MKVLIWFGCYFVATIFNTILGYATGFRIGYLVFYLVVGFVAKKLCNLWDEHKAYKEIKKRLAAQGHPYANGYGYQGQYSGSTYPSPMAGWRCACGRFHPKYESSCVCGKSKFNNLQLEADKICFCRKCGDKLLDSSRFCRKCGAEVKNE